MGETMITLHTGDCLTTPWTSKRNAWLPDPPANIAFMGRKWDKAAAELGFVPPLPPRSKEHLRELQSEFAFQRYWGERFGMMFDQSEDDAVAFVWALPRTAHLTQTALRWAGWRILDSWNHVFGQGWNKNGGHLKPAHEVWFVALKGSPRLNIDAGRVKRGGDNKPVLNGGRMGYGGGSEGYDYKPNTLGSHPPNLAFSHHPDCVRIGERMIKANGGGADIKRKGSTTFFGIGKGDDVVAKRPVSGSHEAVLVYSCTVSCPCGRHWLEPSGGSPSVCECGRQGEWVCPVAELDEQSGTLKSGARAEGVRKGLGYRGAKGDGGPAIEASEGSASRFFPTFGYYAKASGRVDVAEVKRLEKLEKKRATATDPIEIARLDQQITAQRKVVSEADNAIPRGERHAGCEELYWRANKDNPFGFDRVTREEWEGLGGGATSFSTMGQDNREGRAKHGITARGNVHPTVKSIEMMMYLAKLSGGTKIGDLCFGSGGTAIACQLLGLDFEGAELCPEAVEITNARLAYWSGLSIQALESFKLTGELPDVKPADKRQQSLF